MKNIVTILYSCCICIFLLSSNSVFSQKEVIITHFPEGYELIDYDTIKKKFLFTSEDSIINLLITKEGLFNSIEACKHQVRKKMGYSKRLPGFEKIMSFTVFKINSSWVITNHYFYINDMGESIASYDYDVFVNNKLINFSFYTDQKYHTEKYDAIIEDMLEIKWTD